MQHPKNNKNIADLGLIKLSEFVESSLKNKGQKYRIGTKINKVELKLKNKHQEYRNCN